MEEALLNNQKLLEVRCLSIPPDQRLQLLEIKVTRARIQIQTLMDQSVVVKIMESQLDPVQTQVLIQLQINEGGLQVRIQERDLQLLFIRKRWQLKGIIQEDFLLLLNLLMIQCLLQAAASLRSHLLKAVIFINSIHLRTPLQTQKYDEDLQGMSQPLYHLREAFQKLGRRTRRQFQNYLLCL